MSRHADPFTFDTDTPLAPISTGTAVLVAGSGLTGARELALKLVLAGSDRDEGMILASTATPGRRLLAQCRDLHRNLNEQYLRIVDATGLESGPADPESPIAYIEQTEDLSAVGMDISALHDTLQTAGAGSIRTGGYSLTGLLSKRKFKTVYKFVNILANRVRSYDGLGIFYLETSTLEETIVETLRQACDGLITVRGGGRGYELLVDGLAGQPSGWQSFDVNKQWPRGIGEHAVARQVMMSREVSTRYHCIRCGESSRGESSIDNLLSMGCSSGGKGQSWKG